MKKKILILIIASVAAASALTGVVLMHKNRTRSVLSDIYSDKKYIKEINSVELSQRLSTAVDENDVYKVKTAVYENDISPENEEKLALLIEEYNVESALIGYSYLNADFVTWVDLEELVKEIEDKGAAKAIKEYEEKAPVYSPSAFKRSQLEEWINVKGYPAADITAVDKLAKLFGADFNSLMERYESGESISAFKAELGLVNTNDAIDFVAVDKADIVVFAEKFDIEESRAEAVLADLVRLNFDSEKLPEINSRNEYELIDMVLEEKYGGEGK